MAMLINLVTRVNAELWLKLLKKNLEELLKFGDMEKQVEANQALASLTMQEERAKSTKDKKERLKKEMRRRR